LHQLVEAGHRELRVGDLAGWRAPTGHRGEDLFRSVHDFLAGHCAPAEDDHAEDEPGQPGTCYFTATVAVRGAMVGFLVLAFESPNTLGMPNHEEGNQTNHRDHG